MPPATETQQTGAVAAEAARRRTFAIISHPDAGKTTLTEKLLLYGGAVDRAGAVHGRDDRTATVSDWMDLERSRGISITSTLLRFERDDTVYNLLDTPGHRDFSEDTLRVLAAADSAVLLVDAARGVESQTRMLFEVAKAHGLPLLGFVNKYDRPGMEPLAMLDHLGDELGLRPAPLTWPVGEPGDFRGVLDRRTGLFHRFARTARGAEAAKVEILPPDEAEAAEGDAYLRAREELDLLDAVLEDHERSTPILFGSAVWNFGVELLLDALVEHAPAPSARATDDPAVRRDVDAPLSAVVFKVQANLDPRHRDRLAYLRICSGRFERGVKTTNARTGRPVNLAQARQVFGREREVVDEAFPGDVVGVVNAGDVRVGDTLYEAKPVRFPPIPTLAPEHFGILRNRDSGRYKHFRRALEQLDDEGVVQVLQRVPADDPHPVLGAVGPMQFEVALHRLEHEFGVPAALDPAPWTIARRVRHEDEATLKASGRVQLVERTDGQRLALFTTQPMLDLFVRNHPDVPLDRIVVEERS